MKVINPSFEILTPITGNELKLIEAAGRTCYKSENNITDESSKKFVAGLIKRGHEAMLEHSFLSIRFICDRGVSHELVRHRLASFAQESTRYCNYNKDKFGNELTFIKPLFFEFNTDDYRAWENAMEQAEYRYMQLIQNGRTPQEARSVLPNSVKTEVVMSTNYREWRHFFKLRAARATGPAHPQMEELTRPLLEELKKLIPVVFDDIVIKDYQM
jgi:thymidylate synthase (FAD)